MRLCSGFLLKHSQASEDMAPKMQPSALPKAVAEYKEMLEKLGGVTADNVSKSDGKLRSRAMTAMRRSIGDDKNGEFQKLNNDAERREWLAAYIMDPEKGGCLGKNWTQRTSVSSTATVWVWLTQAELEGPRWLNSKENAKIAVSSMTSRKHSTNKALYDAGVLEYRHEIRKEELKKAIEEGARLEQEAEVAPKDYAGMVEHMANSKNPGAEDVDTRPAKKSRTQKAAAEKDKEKESPEKVALKAMCSQHSAIQS